MNDTNENNPLGYEKLSVLLKRFAIPSIIAMVVSSLYNIVDQIFFQTLLDLITVSGPDLEADMWGNLVEAFNQVR